MNVKKFLLVGIGCSLILTIISLLFVTSGKVYSQETAEFERLLLERLEEQSVPVKSLSLGQDSSLEIILQSASNGTKTASGDPAYIHVVQREVAILHDNKAPNLDTIRITILDASSANVLYWGEFSASMISPVVQTTDVTSDELEQLKSWIANRHFNSANITLEKVDLSADSHGPLCQYRVRHLHPYN